MKGTAPFPWDETWEIKKENDGMWSVIIKEIWSGDIYITTGFKSYRDACECLADIYY